MACKSKGKRRRQPTLPVCKSTWWQGVKDGRFLRPVKLGTKTTAWRVEDIRDLIELLGP
jgi:prophage regulatory protein